MEGFGGTFQGIQGKSNQQSLLNEQSGCGDAAAGIPGLCVWPSLVSASLNVKIKTLSFVGVAASHGYEFFLGKGVRSDGEGPACCKTSVTKRASFRNVTLWSIFPTLHF